MSEQSEFDYVVVGAGASGCTVAARLAASGASVALLEAGGAEPNAAVDDIGGFVSLWFSDLDWKLQTEPQSGLGGRQIVINQGRILGGSTAINALMWVRGNRRNFDEWRSLGATGWGYDDLLPYFKKAEDYAGGASDQHGTGGPVRVVDNPDPNSPSEPFQRGAASLGYDGPGWDLNGARQENGAGVLQFSIDASGKRVTAAKAYLDGVAAGRVQLIPGAEATRILFDGDRAVGVEHRGGTARAAREVIVSAGAFLSPKLLLLSGIGPAAELRALGIDTVADLPGVGKNLQDHLQLPIVFAARSELPSPTLLTGNSLFVNTRKDRPDAAPDLQMNFTPAVPLPLKAVINLPIPAGIFLPIMVQPDSRGEVRLRSADPADAPIVDPHYLEAPADVQTLVSAVAMARELAATAAMQEVYAQELAPGPDADAEGYARGGATTLWHPAGTCSMAGEQPVVDPELRVRGVSGLRVVDASIMPTVTSGNTQAGCYVIGEKAADMILAGQAATAQGRTA